MLDIVKRNPLAVAVAVLMHLAILAFLVVGVDWLEKPKDNRPVVDVVKARVIDQAKVQAEVEKLKQADLKKETEKKKEEKRLAD
ncbi:MAG: cell envelope integrity protein TolA, partial [Sedimenticola sp.]